MRLIIYRKKPNIMYMIQLIIMAKFHIHKSKFTGKKPNSFDNDFNQYINSSQQKHIFT